VVNARQALRKISPKVVDAMFLDINWRCRITAAWFCGLKKWRQYEDVIGKSLLESRVCYAGQGYCFAFAHFADEKSSDYLVQYLDLYLPQIDKYFDQTWAIAALIWVDEKRKTNSSSRFLLPGGLWDEYIKGKVETSDDWALAHCKERFNKVMDTSIELFG
jgi:hypothetical protein